MFPDLGSEGSRRIFDLSTNEDCSIFTTALGGDETVDCQGLGICMNIFGYKDFESNNYGDGVSVDVRDIGGFFNLLISFFRSH